MGDVGGGAGLGLARIKGRMMQIKGDDSQVPIRIVTAEAFPPTARFVAQVRANVMDQLLMTLSTENGTITLGASAPVTGGFETEMVFKFPASATKNMVATTIFLDVARVDIAPPEHLGFRLSIEFTTPITRLA